MEGSGSTRDRIAGSPTPMRRIAMFFAVAVGVTSCGDQARIVLPSSPGLAASALAGEAA